mmetsp:Transcript_3344/g.4831  ORF Transcript_3344/g.4831 Transcript_3344/m.4831 type:complete len:277 (+) Transcript_3344:47-877(+)
MVRLLLVVSLISTALAAPALVWNNNNHNAVNDAEAVHVGRLLSTHAGKSDESSLASVLFSIDRAANGQESLSAITPQLESVAKREASVTHYHVWGGDSRKTVSREARNSVTEGEHVLELDFDEFKGKLSNFKEDKVLRKSNTVVVHISENTPAKDIDATVSAAIDHSAVNTVILTGLRGVEEVKHERTFRRMTQNQEKNVSRRRLDEEGEGEKDQNNNNNDENKGMYYALMTPNIFAGILFTLFFAMIASIGINCMGIISNSDVYVSKMPSVGREA